MAEDGRKQPQGRRRRAGPLIAAGTLVGLGMGGFVDGIVLHQLLQWHQMISNVLPPDTLTNKEINMFWDGAFHVVTWAFTAAGIGMLWRLFWLRDVLISTGVLLGALLFGWGLFNFIDSVFNHYLFGLHNVKEESVRPWAWNLGFLALSVAQMGAGWWVIRWGRRRGAGVSD